MDDHKEQTNLSEEKIASFDSVYTSNHIRMLKILTHYLPIRYCKYLAIYIKYLELQQILSPSKSLHAAQDTVSSDLFQDPSTVSCLIQELTPYCTPGEKKNLQQVENMLHTFDQLKNMMGMMEMMNDFKDMFQNEDGSFDPEMLAGMMGNMGDFSFFNN